MKFKNVDAVFICTLNIDQVLEKHGVQTLVAQIERNAICAESMRAGSPEDLMQQVYKRNDSMLLSKSYQTAKRFYRLKLAPPASAEDWIENCFVILSIFSTGVAALTLWMQLREVDLERILELRRVAFSYWLPLTKMKIRLQLPKPLSGQKEGVSCDELVQKYVAHLEMLISQVERRTSGINVMSIYPIFFVRETEPPVNNVGRTTLLNSELHSLLYDTFSWRRLDKDAIRVANISPNLLVGRYLTDACALELFRQDLREELVEYADRRDHLSVEEEFLGQESSTVIIIEVARVLLSTLKSIDSLVARRRETTSLKEMTQLKKKVLSVLDEYASIGIAARSFERGIFNYAKNVMGIEELYTQVHNKLELLDRTVFLLYDKRLRERTILLQSLAAAMTIFIVAISILELFMKVDPILRVLILVPLLIAATLLPWALSEE